MRGGTYLISLRTLPLSSPTCALMVTILRPWSLFCGLGCYPDDMCPSFWLLWGTHWLCNPFSILPWTSQAPFGYCTELLEGPCLLSSFLGYTGYPSCTFGLPQMLPKFRWILGSLMYTPGNLFESRSPNIKLWLQLHFGLYYVNLGLSNKFWASLEQPRAPMLSPWLLQGSDCYKVSHGLH